MGVFLWFSRNFQISFFEEYLCATDFLISLSSLVSQLERYYWRSFNIYKYQKETLLLERYWHFFILEAAI